MNKQDFLNIQLDQISQVYSGKRNCCRCGCQGTYIATSSMKDSRSEVNDKSVAQKLKRAKGLIEGGANYDLCDIYIDIQTGENRTLTFYFDELK